MLKADAKHREQALQDGGEADQYDQELEQIRQPPVAHKSVDDPEQNGANDADDKDVDQHEKHDKPRRDADDRVRLPAAERDKSGGRREPVIQHFLASFRPTSKIYQS
jgi:hypothetical protein